MRERRAITNTGDLFRGLSNLLYVPAFTAINDFHYNPISQDLSDPQHLQVASRSLGPASLSLVFARTQYTNPQAHSRPQLLTTQ